jgi:polysaccharide export outer membrane protein
MPAATSENSSDSYVNMGVGRQTYLVNKEGKIDFPVLGEIKVEGYTPDELEHYLRDIISEKYLKGQVVVSVRLLNFRIVVEGEVGRPGTIGVPRDRINLLEAMALAGNMSIYGKRDDVKIYREMADGTLKVIKVDMTKESLLSSPDFYLQQNDVIIVAPNNARADSADMSPQFGMAMSVGSFLMSLITFVIYMSK